MVNDKKDVSDNIKSVLPEQNYWALPKREEKDKSHEARNNDLSGSYEKKPKQNKKNRQGEVTKEADISSSSIRNIFNEERDETESGDDANIKERSDTSSNAGYSNDESENSKDFSNISRSTDNMNKRSEGLMETATNSMSSPRLSSRNQSLSSGGQSEEQCSEMDAARDLLLLRTSAQNFDKKSYPYKMQKNTENLIEQKSDSSVGQSRSYFTGLRREGPSWMQGQCHSPNADSCLDSGRKVILNSKDVRSQYNKNFASIPKKCKDRQFSEAYDFPGETSPLLTSIGTLSSIQPISSCSKKFTNFRKLNDLDSSCNDGDIASNFTRQELLHELKSVASSEAKAFSDIPFKKEEMFFNPPEFSEKHPLQYLQEAVEADSHRGSPIGKIKPRIYEKEDGKEEDQANFKSFNDFDEDIFKLDMESKLYICPWNGCDKSFPSLSRIKRHYIIHTDIKPFKCLNQGCNRRFSRKDNMLQHYRVHCPFASHGDKSQ